MLFMKKILFFLLVLVTTGCHLQNDNTTATLIDSLGRMGAEQENDDLDSLMFAIPRNGIKSIVPAEDFSKAPALFKAFLEAFRRIDPPFELTETTLDKTDEDWDREAHLDKTFYPYILDKKAYDDINAILNPKESFYDFYKFYPIAKIGEYINYQTFIIAKRYLDGNGQQDSYDLMTFANNGKLLSSIQIGAFEASEETFMIESKVFSTRNLIEIEQSYFNYLTKNWDVELEARYFLDKFGQVYQQYEQRLNSVGGTTTNIAPNRYQLAFPSAAEFETYFAKFQQAIRKNDKAALAELITFPHLRIAVEELFVEIKSETELFERYELIFPKSLRQKIVKQNLKNLIINSDGIGLTDGTLWFKRIGVDNEGQLVVGILIN